MKLSNPFKKKAAKQNTVEVVDPRDMPKPSDLASFLRRGWAYHSRQNESAAEGDFRSALALDGDSVDAHYGLGLSLKSQGRREDAVAIFKKALTLLGTVEGAGQVRSSMLHRLILGHINELTLGDWNLEQEVWHHGT
jgi:tetratricopeptide (TPR) repeat protein